MALTLRVIEDDHGGLGGGRIRGRLGVAYREILLLAEDGGLDPDLAHVVDRHGIGYGLEAQVSAVLVRHGQIAVHGKLAHASAGPACRIAPGRKAPAGIGRHGGVHIRGGPVRIEKGEGGVVLVDVDAVRHGADGIGDGRDGVGGLVFDLQDAGGLLPCLQQSLGLGVGGRHDDLTVRIVVADAHPRLPAFGAVRDLAEDQVRLRAGGEEADGQRQRRAKGRGDPGGNVKGGLMLEGLLHTVVRRIVLVMIRGVDAVVEVRQFQVVIGVHLDPQMQAAEVPLVDEAGYRHAEQAALPGRITGDSPVEIGAKVGIAVRVDHLIDAALRRGFRSLRERLGGDQLAAGDVDGPVDIVAKIVLFAGGIAELQEDVVCGLVSVVAHGKREVEFRHVLPVVVLLDPEEVHVKVADAELRLLFHGQQIVDDLAEGVRLEVACILGQLQREHGAFGQVPAQGQCVEGQNGLGAGCDGGRQLPGRQLLAFAVVGEVGHQAGGDGVRLGGADRHRAGIREFHLADQSLACGEVVLGEAEPRFAQGLIAGAEGDGVEGDLCAAAAICAADGNDCGIVLLALPDEGLLLQGRQSALGQDHELLLRAAFIRYGTGGHLQIGEDQPVHGACVAALRGQLSEVCLFCILSGHTVGNTVLIDLQVAHGKDHRRAPGVQVRIPPGDEDRVGEAVGHRRGVDDGQVVAVGADANVSAGGLRENGGQRNRAAAGEHRLQIGLPEHPGVSAHLKEGQRLRFAVEPCGEEAQVCEIGIRLGGPDGVVFIDTVLQNGSAQIILGAALKVDDGLQKLGGAEAAPVQASQIESADDAALGLLGDLVQVVHTDRDKAVVAVVEVGGLGGGVEHQGPSAHCIGLQIFHGLAGDLSFHAVRSTQNRAAAVEIVQRGKGGPGIDCGGLGSVGGAQGVQIFLRQVRILRQDPGLEQSVVVCAGALRRDPEGLAARSSGEPAEVLGAVHGNGRCEFRARLEGDRPGLDNEALAVRVPIADPGDANALVSGCRAVIQIGQAVVVQEQIRRIAAFIQRMDQTGSLGEVAGHHQAAQHELRLLAGAGHDRIDQIVFVSDLHELVVVAHRQAVHQLPGVAGGVVLGELEIAGARGVGRTGLLAGLVDRQRAGNVRRRGDVDQTLGLCSGPQACVARDTAVVSVDRGLKAVELCALVGRDVYGVGAALVLEFQLGGRFLIGRLRSEVA